MNQTARIHDVTRRHFFQDCGMGLGKIALATLLARDSFAFGEGNSTSATNALDSLHFPPRAKRVIFLFMAGAPSQLDLFDYKPRLKELEGKPIPPSVIQGQRYAFIQPDAAVLGPRFDFVNCGQSGTLLSEVMPHLAKVVDELAIVRSVHTDLFNHAPAQLFMNTGFGIPGRPSMGAWLSYGIGCDADDLPAFVVLKSGSSLSGGAAMWSARFLAVGSSGCPLSRTGRSDFACFEPRWVRPTSATRYTRSDPPNESAATGCHRRSRDCHAHQRLRNGVSNAVSST